MLGVTKASQLDKPAEGAFESPGPIYLPKHVGGIGPQALSVTATEPRVLIGTAPRFPPSKNADQGPGPGAYAIPAPKGPAFSIRGRETFGSSTHTSARDNPGPGHVSRLETSQTRKTNAPAYSLRGRRQELKTSDFTPGPGHTQRVESSTARQALSTKPNVPGIHFGTGKRRELAASTAPVGPGEYPGAGDVTKLAGYARPPAFSMSFRHPAPKPATAAAEFHSPTRGLGKQVVSTSKTAPAFTMSGRTRFCGYAPTRH